ncbi:RNA polymerase sigma factor [Sorangium sp. So ce131]|uniref:RNA polymerase sigma factor n=1 Tax=Sorangium sp. So ce131 TaxID=3133282 RepID=UPI003F5EA5A8
MSPLSPPPDLLLRSTWTSMHATAVHVLPWMLRYLGVDENDLDDLSQEVLLGAYTSLPRYDPAYPGRSRGAASLPAQDLAFAVLSAAAAAEQAGDASSPSLPASTLRSPLDPSLSRRHGLGKGWRSEASWLFGIAWRQVRRHLERAYRRREVPVGLADAACFEGADALPSSEQHIAAKERLVLAIRVLSKIEPERRAILILADAFGIPVPEIARTLGLNESTAASRLRLAREDYRAAVKRLRPEEQRALRSGLGLLMLPLFSHASLHSVVETSAPASAPHPDAPIDRDPRDAAGWPARLARLAHRARPLARLVRPALAWGAIGVVGAVVVAALARAPASWARRLGPAAAPHLLSLSRPVHPGTRPAAAPGEAPREAPQADATSSPRAPAREAENTRNRRHRRDPATNAAPAPQSPLPGPKPPPASSAREQEPLAEELQLLDAARQALLQGDRAAALARIGAHEQRFPQGRLKLMRERLRSKAEAPPPVAPGGSSPAAPGGSAVGQELP